MNEEAIGRRRIRAQDNSGETHTADRGEEYL